VRRILNWLGLGVGALALLLLLAALILPSLINLERYRTALASRAGRALGREVTLEDLRVSLWGGLGAEAGGLRIAQAAGAGSEPFLAADALRIHVQLLPLLRGQIRVTSAVLERPRILVSRGQDGTWSVADLFHPTGEAPAPKRQAEPPRAARPAPVGALFLPQVGIRHGEVTLLDESRSPAIRLTLSDLDLTLRQGQSPDVLSVQSHARLSSPGPGRLEAIGSVSAGGTEGPVLDLTLAVRDTEAGPFLQPFFGKEGAFRITGPVGGEVRVKGALAHASFDGAADLQAATIQVGSSFQKPAGEEASLQFQGQREGAGVSLPRIGLTLKGTTATGSLRIPDLQAPQATFSVHAATLDLDRLLARPEPKQSWLGVGIAHAAEATPAPSVRGSGGGFAAQGRISVDELRYLALAWSGVLADVRYQGDVVQLPRILASVAGGRVTAKGEIDLRPKVPRVALTSRVENLATDPVVKALGLGPWTLKSTLAQEGSVTFTGSSLAEMLGSANGSGSLSLRDGRIDGYKPLERLADVAGPFLATQGLQVRFDEFQQLAGHYTLDKGILRTSDLTLTKSEGVVTAVGALGLQDGSLDFDVVARAGRNAISAKLTGTTKAPIAVLKLDKVQQKVEREIDKVLPGEQGKNLKGILRGLFGR
jgi:AsmA protein